MTDARALLEQIDGIVREAGEDAGAAALAYIAAQALDFRGDELQAALRRALLVLAAGGDPHRALESGAPATRALADDLDTPTRRAELTAALDALLADAAGLDGVTAVLVRLREDADLAWRWLACALLAAEISGEGED